MQIEINRFVLIIGRIAFAIGGVFLVIALVSGYGWVEAVIFTIGIIVASVCLARPLSQHAARAQMCPRACSPP